ncbi:phosphopantetheine-binding protein [Marinobacter sp. SS21]|uniref:phosphopantetheine-binding protein n=1 Tax=Marinobacter sp. SS21 TaxID=2979460 RepID=UPI002330A193|nr:phosphopantetheine-binding protein [Marinobacter sp. SS21]MDC0662365.1 phosphopantetheine-binding protein [Marinobacter sp. SS21]
MSTIKEKIQQCLVEHLRMVSAAEDIDPNAELTTLGLTSMAATNLLIDLEDEFGVEFSDDLLTPEVFRTVASLETAIEGLLADQVTA